MLKIKLDKAAHAALPPAIQTEYKADGDGFILDTDSPFEDVSALKTALTQEKKHRKEATEKVTELSGSVASLTSDVETLTARASKPTDLEKSWQTKLEKATADAKAEKERLTGQLNKLLVDNVAISLASEISTAPELILPHIKARLGTEEVDGVYHTRVLDDAGKVSADSVKELKQNLVADPRFAAIITASKASGGGAQGGKGGGGGAAPKPFKDMSESEKVSLFKANRPEYDRLSAESKQTKTV